MNVNDLERQTADELAASLTRNPGAWAWRENDFDMICGPNGIRIGVSFFTIYAPRVVKFGFWNKRRIKRAFRTWKRIRGNDLANKERHRSLLTLRRCLTELRAVA